MVTDQFGALIQELSEVLGYQINPEVEDTCLVPLPNGIEVQMELDQKKDVFVMAAEVGNVPLGRYREDIFREAMLFNGLVEKVGIFGYSEIDDVLMFFRNLPLRNLNGEKIAALLLPLGQKADDWKKAITQGEMPPT